jgi:hypothetical protein
MNAVETAALLPAKDPVAQLATALAQTLEDAGIIVLADVDPAFVVDYRGRLIRVSFDDRDKYVEDTRTRT